MLSATVYNDETSWSVSGVQAIVSAITEPSNLLWIDLEGPDEEELDEIARGLDLHELAVEDVRKHGQRAKLNRYPLHAFLVAYARADDGDLLECAVAHISKPPRPSSRRCRRRRVRRGP